MRDHRGDYGIDRSFHTISPPAQALGIGAGAAGLAVWAGISWARGRRLTLLAAAKRLPRGRAIGVDLWQADQTDSSAQSTLANAELEGVADRVELHTADMTALPSSDESVDVVVSNLAIHNIPTRAGRRLALDQAVRVLRPGGRLAIADLRETRQHQERLRELGWRNVRRRNLGWRMWYGGPWFSTRLVSATKPG